MAIKVSAHLKIFFNNKTWIYYLSSKEYRIKLYLKAHLTQNLKSKNYIFNREFSNRLYIYIYIISDFKELNYTKNTNYVVYSHIKGPVNSESSQMRCNNNSGFKHEECNMFKMEKNTVFGWQLHFSSNKIF